MAGIRDILVITTPEDAPAFRSDCSATARDFGINITYAVQERPDGLAQAFVIGADHIGADSVALVLGDNIFYGPGLGTSLRRFQNVSGGADFRLLGGQPVRLRRRRVRRRRPALSHRGEAGQRRNPLRGAGPVLLRQRRRRDRAVLKPSARGEYEITDVNRAYLEPGPAGGRGAAARHSVAGHRHVRFAAGRRRLRPHHRDAAGAEDQRARGGRVATRLHRRRPTADRAETLLKSGYGAYLLELLER